MKKERSGSTLSMNSRRRVREAPGVNQKRKEEGEGTRNRKKLWPGIFKRKENFGIRKSFGQQGKLCNVPDVIGPMGVRCRITGVCQGVFMAAIVAYGFYRSMAAFALLLILVCVLMRNTQEKVNDGRYGGRRIAVTVGLLLWSVLSLSDVSEFLYFNF